MELTLNVGDNINIPENCEVVVKDNTLTIKEKPRNFKDGDILVVKDNSSFIVIFKEYDKLNKETFISYFNNQGLSNTNWSSPCFRKATEEEKQNFLNGLEERGLKWDPTVKVVELYDDRSTFDTRKYNLGNYYLPEEREQAEEDAKIIKAIYENRIKL